MQLHQPLHRPPGHTPTATHLTALPASSAPTHFPRPEQFRVEIRPARQLILIAPHGELDLATADELTAAIEGVVESGFADIVLDLRQLSFIDSTGLRLIIAQAARADARVRIIDGVRPVARLFDLSGVRHKLPFLTPHEVLLLRV
jgi:anti-sigma B factor antagonist